MCWAVESNVMRKPSRGGSESPDEYATHRAAFRMISREPRRLEPCGRASAVNPSLRMMWRTAADFATSGRGLLREGKFVDVAGSVEFPVLPLHRFCVRRRA